MGRDWEFDGRLPIDPNLRTINKIRINKRRDI